jgi:flagellin
LTSAFTAELKQSILKDDFDIETTGAGVIKFSAKEAGTDKLRVISSSSSMIKNGVYEQKTNSPIAVTNTTVPTDAFQKITENIGQYTGQPTEDIDDYIFTVNGERFMYTDATGAEVLKTKKDYADVNYVVGDAAGNASDMATLINSKTGINAQDNGTDVELKPAIGSKSEGDGMELQIGANEGQTMKFSIDDMSAKALGVDGNKVDLSTQDQAKKAMTTIDAAIKKVSSQRSQLGAVQNRLEHTISNLDTAAENTQNAESSLRDTDMAKEMVEFSKNNILAQAGQSMLAQANQSNQGVLSLLG